MSAANVKVMEFTGERMLPDQSDISTFWEHIYRYRFALQYVRGKRVLDIACGEGYGTASLERAGALSVIGVDISDEACQHASDKYGIDARIGNAENIPLPNNSVDVVVSFETIEHISNPEAFVQECVRIMTPGGRLVISTPNKDVYGHLNDNPYHCSEMTYDEFTSLLRKYFKNVKKFTQHPVSISPYNFACFAADNHDWQNVRGVKRIQRLLRKTLCPDIDPANLNSHRESPVETILGRSRPFSNLVNPYAVHSFPSWYREQAIFYIAVAQM